MKSMSWWRVAMPRRLSVLIVLGIIATATDFLPVKMSVPILAAVFIVVSARRREAVRWRAAVSWRGWIIAALLLSAAGDVFMSSQETGGNVFLFTGIAVYMVAHLAYIAAAMVRGRFRWGVFAVVLIIVGTIAVLALVPVIESRVIAGAIVVYTVISAVSLAAATGIADRNGRIYMSVAIGLILLSDIAIGFRLFLDVEPVDILILPTYFASHVLLARDAIIPD